MSSKKYSGTTKAFCSHYRQFKSDIVEAEAYYDDWVSETNPKYTPEDMEMVNKHVLKKLTS